MKIIKDDQGRILYYPSGWSYPSAYLIPTEEISDSLEKKDANFSFYWAFLYFILIFLILPATHVFTETYLKSDNHLKIKQFFSDYFNIKDGSELTITSFFFFIFLFIILNYTREKWLTWHFPKISLSDSYNCFARSMSWTKVFFDIILIMFLTTFITINPPNEFPKTSIFTARIDIIVYVLFLIRIIQDFILIYYKIHQSWEKSKQ